METAHIRECRSLWKCMSRLKNKLAVSDEISLMSFRKEGYMLEVMEK